MAFKRVSKAFSTNIWHSGDWKQRRVLGVLLYKLCYYTTPFEEHGPLAILNVQYKIPPYPVYSAQMNSLIGMSSIASGFD
jgi:hypothetical protein